MGHEMKAECLLCPVLFLLILSRCGPPGVCQHLLSLGKGCERGDQAYDDVRKTPGARRPTPGSRKSVVKIKLGIHILWEWWDKDRALEWASEFKSCWVFTGSNRMNQLSAGLESQLGRKGKKEETG